MRSKLEAYPKRLPTRGQSEAGIPIDFLAKNARACGKIRRTQAAKEWINSTATKLNDSLVEEYGFVHERFQCSYEDIRGEALEMLGRLASKKSIFIASHSLGTA